MDAPRKPDPPRTPRGPWRPSPGLLPVAAVLVGGALAWWWVSTTVVSDAAVTAPAAPVVRIRPEVPAPASPPVVAASPGGTPAVRAPAPEQPPQRIARNRDPDGDQTPDLSDYVNPGEQPTMGEVIQRLHQAGIRSGLGAFSPPGTRPPLVGLAVPEDFVLPDGYVRHYQATDDGQRIEPILMFAPDRPVFDAYGRPVEIPADRVVPPDLAPPGLPRRTIAIPAPLETGRPRS